MTVSKMATRKKIKKGGGKCDLSSIYSRLHRINGQVSAIERMLKQKRDFVEILQQLVASREALDKVAIMVLESEANGCLKGRQSSKVNKELQRVITALFKVI